MRTIALSLAVVSLAFVFGLCSAGDRERPHYPARIGSIAGTVTLDGSASSGWMLGLQEPTTGALVGGIFVEADGSYLFTNVPTGVYDLTLLQLGGLRRGAGLASTTAVSVLDKQVTQFDFSMTSVLTSRHISGTISPAHEGVAVGAYRAGQAIALTLTDAGGYFELMVDSGPAEVVVVAWPDDQANALHSVNAGRDNVALGTINLSSANTGSVAGTMQYASGATATVPAVNVRMYAMRDVAGSLICFGKGVSNSNGDYTIRLLPAGDYTLRSEEDIYMENGSLPRGDSGYGPPDDPGVLLLGPYATRVAVTAGQQTNRDFALAWSSAITVVITDAGRQDVTDALVTLEHATHGGTQLCAASTHDAASDTWAKVNTYNSIEPVSAGMWTLRIKREGQTDYTSKVLLTAGQRLTTSIRTNW